MRQEMVGPPGSAVGCVEPVGTGLGGAVEEENVWMLGVGMQRDEMLGVELVLVCVSAVGGESVGAGDVEILTGVRGETGGGCGSGGIGIGGIGIGGIDAGEGLTGELEFGICGYSGDVDGAAGIGNYFTCNSWENPENPENPETPDQLEK